MMLRMFDFVERVKPRLPVRSAALSLLLLSHCNGELSTTVVDPNTLQPVQIGLDGKPGAPVPKPGIQTVAGVIAYRPMRVTEVYRFTQYDPGDKKPFSSDCATPSFLVRKVDTIADTDHPIQLKYTPGLLEASEFGATLNGDGVLLEVNNKSTPDQGKTIENLTSAAANVARSAAVVGPEHSSPATDKAVCNATLTFMGYEKSPVLADVLPFGTCQPSAANVCPADRGSGKR